MGILEKMERAYTECRSYSDEATLVGSGYVATRTKSELRFVRPELFRFEYKDTSFELKGTHAVCWSDGKQIRTWWDVDWKVETFEELGLPLAGYHGVSSQLSTLIPGLLMDLDPPSTLGNLKRARLMGEETVDGIASFKVQASLVGGALTLWIGQTDHLIRKLVAVHEIDGEEQRSVYTFRPQIDIEIDASEFEFAPPKKPTAKKKKKPRRGRRSRRSRTWLYALIAAVVILGASRRRRRK